MSTKKGPVFKGFTSVMIDDIEFEIDRLDMVINSDTEDIKTVIESSYPFPNAVLHLMYRGPKKEKQ